jgi:hypothetical protein
MSTGMTTGELLRQDQPMTAVVRNLITLANDPAMISDLLFLERWERAPNAGMGSVLRAAQIRRANPILAAAVRAEVAAAR